MLQQVVTLEGVKITDFDIRADNGYIHVLDSVMLPPEGSIVDVVAGASELSTLLAQVQDVNLAAALQGTLMVDDNCDVDTIGFESYEYYMNEFAYDFHMIII